MNASMPIMRNGKQVVIKDREYARGVLSSKLPLADKPGYEWIAEDAAFRLKWIDCAPEGANFILAPLQDFAGVPMGEKHSMNLGPGKHLRDARIAKGRNPFITFSNNPVLGVA